MISMRVGPSHVHATVNGAVMSRELFTNVERSLLCVRLVKCIECALCAIMFTSPCSIYIMKVCGDSGI